MAQLLLTGTRILSISSPEEVSVELLPCSSLAWCLYAPPFPSCVECLFPVSHASPLSQLAFYFAEIKF